MQYWVDGALLLHLIILVYADKKRKLKNQIKSEQYWISEWIKIKTWDLGCEKLCWQNIFEINRKVWIP